MHIFVIFIMLQIVLLGAQKSRVLTGKTIMLADNARRTES